MKVIVDSKTPRNNRLQQLKLLLLEEAPQAKPFLEQQVIPGGSVSRCWWDSLGVLVLVGQPWCRGGGGMAPCLSKLQLLCSLRGLNQASFDQCWCSSVQNDMLHFLTRLIIWDQVWYSYFFFFLLDWMNWTGLKRRQNSLEGSQIHYLIAIIMLSCLVSFHVFVTKQDSVWQVEGWISNINSLFIPQCDLSGVYYII